MRLPIFLTIILQLNCGSAHYRFVYLYPLSPSTSSPEQPMIEPLVVFDQTSEETLIFNVSTTITNICIFIAIALDESGIHVSVHFMKKHLPVM